MPLVTLEACYLLVTQALEWLTAIIKQKPNTRNLRIHCKSFTVREDKCKINPCRTKQLKKYIMKQLAKRGRNH